MFHTDTTDSKTMNNRRSVSSREKNFSEFSQRSQKFVKNSPIETKGFNTIYHHPDVNCIAEYIRNKFYFATLANGRREPRNLTGIHMFNIDDELVYNNYYNDFGPLNLACLYKYCFKVNKKLRNPANKHKQIVHYTSQNREKISNAAFLIASYAILYLKKNPAEAQAIIVNELGSQSLRPFQDASQGPSIYNIRLQDCLNAIHKAATFGFFDFDDFDVVEYEKYERMKNGDLNWMIPQKFIAFTGPSDEISTVYNPPELYTDYFTRNGVVAVVRLNKKIYDREIFARSGMAHHEMFMPDGSSPPRGILEKFLRLAETTNGPIAIHCKAGLGRTGSLIAAYLVKHYEMTAREAIAWTRICRPGSVIGHQQAWLETMENELRQSGRQYRLKHHGDVKMILHHKRGIYSVARKLEKNINFENRTGKASICSVGNETWKRNANLSNASNKIIKPGITSILGKLCMARGSRLTRTDGISSENDEKLRLNSLKCRTKIKDVNRNERTQGDRLNDIKAERNKYCQADFTR